MRSTVLHFDSRVVEDFFIYADSFCHDLLGNIYSMNILVFQNIKPCSPLKINRRFRGTRRIHFQGRIISQTGNQLEVGTINIEDRGEIFPSKLLLTT